MTLAVAVAINEPHGRFIVSAADSRLTSRPMPGGPPIRKDGAKKAHRVGASLITLAGLFDPVLEATGFLRVINKYRKTKSVSVLTDACAYYLCLRSRYATHMKPRLEQLLAERGEDAKIESDDFHAVQAMLAGFSSDGVPTIVCMGIQGAFRKVMIQRAYPGQAAAGAIGWQQCVPAAIDTLRSASLVTPVDAASAAMSVMHASTKVTPGIGGAIRLAAHEGNADWRWPYVRYGGDVWHRGVKRALPKNITAMDLTIDEVPFQRAMTGSVAFADRVEHHTHVNFDETTSGSLRCPQHGTWDSFANPDLLNLGTAEREALILLEVIEPETQAERELLGRPRLYEAESAVP